MTYPQEPRWGDPQLSGDPQLPADPRSPEWRDPGAQPWWANRPGQQPGFPQSPMYAGPPPDPRRRRLAIALGVSAVLIIVLGVVFVADRSSTPQPQQGIALPFASDNPFPNGGPIADPPSVDPAPTDLPPTDLAPTDPEPTDLAPTDAAPSDAAPAVPAAPPTGDPSNDPVSTTKTYYGDLAADQASAAWDLLCNARQQAMPLAGYQTAYAQDEATGTGIKSFSQSGSAQVSGNDATVPGTLVLADKESVPITVLLLKESSGWRVCGSDLGGVLPNPGTGGSGPGTVTT